MTDMHANKKLASMLSQIFYFYHFRPRSPFSKLTLLSYIVQGCYNHPYSKKNKNIGKGKTIELRART
jgi:hypothetical protein